MAGINFSRVLLGGAVAGLVIFVLEGLASTLYMDQMTAAMEAHDLTVDMSASGWALLVLVSLLGGIALVFFYAAARPRFGAGPRTAAIVAVALFVGGYLPSLIGYGMMGLFPTSLLAVWGLIGLVELVVASVVGAWLYKES